ncbi:ATP-binding protein [Streptomyces sp. NPDC087422]|uniref:ATP-binding protein n=1 Tax=Streptomyces sp. NPDC087422 TaxID=3365786 RepID=UPI003830BAF0
MPVVLAGMIVWLNGTFGVGKTTTSRLLTELLPDARIFDSETVGSMLRPVLASVPVADFQDHPPWRALVVKTAAQILGYVGGTLVVPQSVLVRAYWTELRDGLAKSRIPLRHFVLHADPLTLAARIDTPRAPASDAGGTTTSPRTPTPSPGCARKARSSRRRTSPPTRWRGGSRPQ